MEMKYNLTMQEVEDNVAALRQIFDVVRMISVEGLFSDGFQGDADGCKCYSFWKKDKRCDNCISRKAAMQRKMKVKLEYVDSTLYQVFSKYVEIDHEPYVMEMIKQLDMDSLIDPQGSEKLVYQLTGYTDKLYEDALTGAHNRRYFEDSVKEVNMPGTGVVIIDLDDFKLYNDVYGHQAGDMALVTAANAIRSNMREKDTLIRYGGDEFLMVLPKIGEAEMDTLLETICKAVYESEVPGYARLQLSASIGGVIAGEEPIENAVGRADRLMYQAKNQKNRVVTEHTATVEEKEGISGAEQEQGKQQILIVDDSDINREILSAMLCEDYRILEATNGSECLEILQQQGTGISLVLLDIMMPVMDGFEVLSRMNRNHWIEDIPVIMISSEDADLVIRRAYEMGVSDYINRPFDAKVVFQRVFNTIKLYAKQRRLVSLVTAHINEKEKNNRMMIDILSHIVEFRNGESGMHVIHINKITQLLLDKIVQKTDKYPTLWQERSLIETASALHDIGKIGIDEAILNKPGRLTAEEFEHMKTHTTIGADMLRNLPRYQDERLLQIAIEICQWHHERYDGKGYPDGLVGDEIPISAQLVSIADVYDALTSERVYKKAFSHEKAMQMIRDGECGAFNPLLLSCLEEIADELQTELQPEL